MRIVFDFDGTIINDDSFVALKIYLYKQSSLYKKILVRILDFLYMHKMISNTSYKQWIIKLLVKGMKKEVLIRISSEIAHNIISQNRVNDFILNNLVKNLQDGHEVIIVSASPTELVKKILEDIFFKYGFAEIFKLVKVYGSEFLYDFDNETIKGLKNNLYKENKLFLLKKLGWNYIDIFYTDSIESDKPLIDIAKVCFLVKSDSDLIEEVKNGK